MEVFHTKSPKSLSVLHREVQEYEKYAEDLKKEKEALQAALKKDTTGLEAESMDVEGSLMQQYIEELRIERNLLKNIISKDGAVAEPMKLQSIVYISNLPRIVTEDEIKTFLESDGSKLTFVNIYRCGVKQYCTGDGKLGYLSYAAALKGVINFDGILFKGKKLSLMLKSKLIEPEFDDYEGWDKIWKEKIERYQSLTVVFKTFEKRPEEDIRVLFSECGEITSITWKKTPTGFMVPPAFVTFDSFDAVRKALHLNKTVTSDGEKVIVKICTSGTYKGATDKTASNSNFYRQKRLKERDQGSTYKQMFS